LREAKKLARLRIESASTVVVLNPPERKRRAAK
jgi:hypothetical protein